MSTEALSDEELQMWANSLPHTGPYSVPKESLDRISIGVARKIAWKEHRRESWFKLWQPAIATSLTLALAGWLIFFHANTELTPKSAVRSDLISALAPTLPDSSLGKITADDIESLFSDETSKLTIHPALSAAGTDYDFDSESAAAALSPRPAM